MKTAVSIILVFLIWLCFNSCQKKFLCPDCEVNQAPVANAGSDQVIALPQDVTVLNGSNSSDRDGKIVSYKWRIVSGPFISTIVNTDSAKTDLKNLGVGTYKFELKVVDDDGAMARDTMQIIVNPVGGSAGNKPPIAIAGVDQSIILPIDTVLLSANQSYDPDGIIITYQWTKIAGPSSTLINIDPAQTTVKDMNEGIYQFELKVTDNGGLTSKDTVKITVNEPPPPPPLVADAGVDMIVTLPLDSAWLNGYSNDPSVKNYQWTQISGPSTCSFEYANSPTTCVKNLVPGQYSFRLEIKNDTSTSVDIMNLTVIDDPQERKTVIYKNLKWQYGHVFGATTPSVFILKPDWFDLSYHPVEVYLQLDSDPLWFRIPATRDGITYWKDDVLGLYRLWIGITTIDMSWVGKESNMKVKIL